MIVAATCLVATAYGAYLYRKGTFKRMPITPSQIATLVAQLEEGNQHSMRFLSAAFAMHGLLASGAALQFDAAKCAKVAYDIGEAFLVETVDRLLPKDS